MSRFQPRFRNTIGCAAILDKLHLVGATKTGAIVHTTRNFDNSWEPFQVIHRNANIHFGEFSEGDLFAVGCATVSNNIQVAGVTLDGDILHTLQQDEGPFLEFGNVKDAVNAGDPGDILSLGMAGLAGELHLASVTISGRLFHTLRRADGSWQPFGNVKSLGAARMLGDVTGVTCAALKGEPDQVELHLVAVTADGGLFHTIRHPDLTWQIFGDILDEANAGNPGRVVAVGCAGVGGDLHVAAVTDIGELFHTIRNTEQGTWLRFGNVMSEGGAGNPGKVMTVACAQVIPGDFDFPSEDVRPELHLVVATDTGDLFHTVRHPDQTWELFENITVFEKAGRPGQFQPLLPAPMDLVWAVTDENGLPKNPQWGSQFIHPGTIPDPSVLCLNDKFSLPCTTQVPRLDIPGQPNIGPCSVSIDGGRLHGHINWLPATYEGLINFDRRSGDDFDYNFHLLPPRDEGLTISNKDAHELEFDSRETILHFATPFWKQFREAVNGDVLNVIGNPGRLINGKFAIVTGLFGLDNVHSNHTELHPVWALAVRVRDNPLDQMWAIFVRNWGNEGYCSKDQHFLDLPSGAYTFRLPWVTGATDVSVHTGTQFLSNADETPIFVAIEPGEGVFVTFVLPQPEVFARVNGELHLHWRSNGKPFQMQSFETSTAATEEHEDLSFLDAFLEKLSPQQQEELERLMQPDLSLDGAPPQLQVGAVSPIAWLIDPQNALRSEFDAQKAALDQREFDFLQAALGDELPHLP